MRKTLSFVAVAALALPAFAAEVAPSLHDALTLTGTNGWDPGADAAVDYFGPTCWAFDINDGVVLTESETPKVSLYCGDALLASASATNTTVVDFEDGFPSFNIPGALEVAFRDVMATEYGEYRLAFDEGFFMADELPVPAGEFTVTFSAPEQPTTIKDYLTLEQARFYDPDTMVSKNFPEAAPNAFEFKVADGVILTKEAGPKVYLYHNDTEIASADVKSACVSFEEGETFGTTVFPAYLYINFYNDKVLPTEPGTYVLVFDEGFLVKNGEPVIGGEYEFGFGGAADVDFSYRLEPTAGTKLEKLSTITLTFEAYEGQDMVGSVNGVVATLTNADGTFSMTSEFPSCINGVVKFEFGNEDTVWPAGEYTFTVNPDMIVVGVPDVDPYNDKGNFAGLGATYTVTGFEPAPKPELKDYIYLLFPEENCDNETTATEDNPEGGMMTYAFQLASSNITIAPADTYPEWIQLRYVDPVDGMDTYFPGLDPNSEGVTLDGVAALDMDDDLPEVGGSQTLTLNFDTTGDWGVTAADYRKSGTYTLTIPDGVFLLDGVAMVGTEFVFNYTDKTSGVAAVEEAETYTVYTIDGRVLYNGAEKNALDTLDAGLYIINGKKVLLAK